MTLRGRYDSLPPSARLVSEDRARAIVAEAVAHVRTALEPGGPDPRVTPRLVAPATMRGGSLIPAWPERQPDGSVIIELVDDWGALLAAWRDLAGETPAARELADALIASGQRTWIGIANDVLQLYVPDPPSGTYSMVRHHALMLVAATLWLGGEAAAQWAVAHTAVARSYLRRHRGTDLRVALEAAENGLARLLERPEARRPAPATLEWLDADPPASLAYRDFLGAASLGVAALLDSVPMENPEPWLRRALAEHHPRPDFNQAEIAAFAQRADRPVA